MLKIRRIVITGAAALALVSFTACESKTTDTTSAAEEAKTAESAAEGTGTNDAASAWTASGESLPFFQYNDIYGLDGFDAVDAAAYDYLSFEKESEYDPFHAMVPYVQIVAIDDTDPSDVLLYGDYWLWEFEKQDDTLVAVSGGHCPGIIHAERFGEGDTAIYSAISMEEAFTDDDAEELFGEYYDQYQKLSSDQETRDAKIAQIIADYVNTNQLDVTRYQLAEEDVKDLP